MRPYSWRICDPATCCIKHKHFKKRCPADCTKSHGHCYEGCTRTIHDHNVGDPPDPLRPTGAPPNRARNPSGKKATKPMICTAYHGCRAQLAASQADAKDCAAAKAVLAQVAHDSPEALESLTPAQLQDAQTISQEQRGRREAAKEAAYKELRDQLALAKDSLATVHGKYDESKAREDRCRERFERAGITCDAHLVFALDAFAIMRAAGIDNLEQLSARLAPPAAENSPGGDDEESQHFWENLDL